MTRPVREIDVVLPDPALADADWVDGWQAEPAAAYATARAAAEAVFGTMPAWVGPLMAIRGLLVAPLGLKTGLDRAAPDPAGRVGFFPLISDTSNRIVVGLDDRHLDFRCAVDLDGTADRQTVTVTTLIRRHNRLGHTYLATILPFHRLILRACLSRI